MRCLESLAIICAFLTGFYTCMAFVTQEVPTVKNQIGYHDGVAGVYVVGHKKDLEHLWECNSNGSVTRITFPTKEQAQEFANKIRELPKK